MPKSNIKESVTMVEVIFGLIGMVIFMIMMGFMGMFMVRLFGALM